MGVGNTMITQQSGSPFEVMYEHHVETMGLKTSTAPTFIWLARLLILFADLLMSYSNVSTLQ